MKEIAARAGRPDHDILDFSANVNPLGPPFWFRSLVGRNLGKIVHYPEPQAESLVSVIAGLYNRGPQEVAAGNGSSEILFALPRLLGAERAFVFGPSYIDYAHAARLAGLAVTSLSLLLENDFAIIWSELSEKLQGNEIVFIGQPNNPTGVLSAREDILAIAGRHPSTWFVIDESFADFVEGYESLATEKIPNLILVKSLTKFYGIAGLRLGLCIAKPQLIEKIQDNLPPWRVNTLALEIGKRALQDTEYGAQTRIFVHDSKQMLIKELSRFQELMVFPGTANYLLLRIHRADMDAVLLRDLLLKKGIAIRVCDNFDGLDTTYFRCAVRREDENQRLVKVLADIFKSVQRKTCRKTPALMFQGTGSNAGKSILNAALCRILLQDGLRVAPFKAQNMSLNSFVTKDGLEMGRAQVVQAQACRQDPDVRMNPVLLKPSGNTGSQVIVNGRPVANMSVKEYIRYKPKAWQQICAAYDTLAADYDALILEGAGSPAEVNLKHHDIVNMRMAEYAAAPVLLIGDIDRGGVFASFVGTMDLLSEKERRLVAGFIVNKFRGDESLLADAFLYMKEHTGKPVLGTIPHVSDLGLPEEDSVSFKAGLYQSPPPAGDHVEIVLIDLPHISNFTDMEPLLAEPDVYLRVVRKLREFDDGGKIPDALILPGSKNVISDLGYLEESGLGQRIRDLTAGGNTEIIGICGGFQMLGQVIADPHGLESSGLTRAGLGLLDLKTSLAREKTLTRQTFTHIDSGLPVHGYEIHHGVSEGTAEPLLMQPNNAGAGAVSKDSMCWGSYLHGIFDADLFRRWFINRLRQRQGLAPLPDIQAPYDLEPAFDRIAEVVRSHVDMNRIYRLLKL